MYSPICLDGFLFKMSKSKRKLFSILCGAGAVMGAWRGRVRKALQGRCGRWGLENSNSSERLHTQEAPQQAVAGKGKEGIVARLGRGEER